MTMGFTRHALRGFLAASLGLVCLPALGLVHHGDLPADPTHVDFRPGQVLPGAEQLALATTLGASRVNWNRFGTVHSMIKYGGYLAEGYSGTEVEAARQFILDNRALFRLSPDGVADLQLVNDGVTPGNPGHAVLFRQTFAGLPSANDGLITIGVVRGKIYYVSSSSAGDQPLPGPAVLTPMQAWLLAAADVNRYVSPAEVLSVKDQSATRGWHLLDVRGFAQPQRARLRAMAIPEGGVRQVWETVVLDVKPGVTMAYVHFVDAGSGQILRREDRVAHQAGAGTTNNPFNGALPNPEEQACGTPHEFDVPDGMATLSGTVAMAVTTNDIFLNMYYVDPVNGPQPLPVSINDTGTSPESITYQPAGGVTPGTYQLEICWYGSPSVPPQEPYEYAGNFAWTDADAPDPEPFPPQWSWFTSNPSLDVDPDGTYADDDIRQLGCWFDTVVVVHQQPVAGRGP
jgi:extracellular elastinolytic metalloproteinase